MPDSIDNLILNLLDWLSQRQRTYDETMSAWRTCCPRLPVWEEANDRGLLEIAETRTGKIVRLTSAGSAYLRKAAK